MIYYNENNQKVFYYFLTIKNKIKLTPNSTSKNY